MGRRKGREPRIPKVPAMEVLAYQIAKGTPGLVRFERSGPWRRYVASHTQWYSADEATSAGMGQLLIRRGEWEFMVDLCRVHQLVGNKAQSHVKEARGLSLEDKILQSLSRAKPKNVLSPADTARVFAYALDPDQLPQEEKT